MFGIKTRLTRLLSHEGRAPVPVAQPASSSMVLRDPFLDHSQQLNELTNPNKWTNAEWLAIHLELETYSVDKHCFSTTTEFAYRKGWEWTQALYGFHRLGCIHPDAQGLGVGAGREPLLFYLADRIARVVGTDLYGNAQWSREGGREATAELLENPRRYCARDCDLSRLELLSMDGTSLDFEDETFDLVWSLSSIEHFGSHEKSRKSVEEMGRVTKKGGIVCVATEVILTPDLGGHPEFFTRAEFDRYVIHASDRMIPIQPFSYDLPPLEYLLDPIMVHLAGDVHRRRHHIVLNDGRYQWTSGMVFYRRV